MKIEMRFRTASISSYELIYRNSGNTIHFSFLATVYSFPTYPEKCETKKIFFFFFSFFKNRESKAKLILAVTVNNYFNTVMSFFIKAVLLLNVHVNCLETRFFSQI